MAENIKYRRHGGYLILKAPFCCLCQEIVSDLALEQQIRWQTSAVESLMVVAELFRVMRMRGKMSSSPSIIIGFTNLFFIAGALDAAHAVLVMLRVQDVRLVADIMNVMAGQPAGSSREEMRGDPNPAGGAPRAESPPAPPPAPPPRAHLRLLPLLLSVLLILGVYLVLRVFLLPGMVPPLLLLGVHLLNVVTLPVTREPLSITDPVPITVVTATVTTVIIHLHLDAVAWMVALGALAGLVVVVLRRVLGVWLDNEIWLGVWVLVWEMEVVVSKVIPEVPSERMIPGKWILGRVVAVVGW